MERHYGMDWLRIGAFGLLILYHVGMVFVPWPFQVKTAHPLVWAEIPMFLTAPWRLTLLFVVSGYASRALLAKAGGTGAFLRSRSARLLPPFLFGIAVIVPPQTWVELSTQHGYAAPFLHFWAHDYFRFGTLGGIVMPTWNHLWFVLYLWVYSAALAGGSLLVGGSRAQALFDRAFSGWRAVVIPALYFVLLEAVLFHRTEDTHDLIGDGVAHLRYVPAFLIGFGLARSPTVLAALSRHWKTSAAVATLCFATIAVLLVAYPRLLVPRPARCPVDLPGRAAARDVDRDRRPGRRGGAVLEPGPPLARDARGSDVPVLRDPPDDHCRRRGMRSCGCRIGAGGRICASWSPQRSPAAGRSTHSARGSHGCAR